MRHYRDIDFSGEFSVSEGVPLRALVEDVLSDYYPEISEKTVRDMAEEIAELRIMAYQEGYPWPFSSTLLEKQP